jgi:hypothetical protein
MMQKVFDAEYYGDDDDTYDPAAFDFQDDDMFTAGAAAAAAAAAAGGGGKGHDGGDGDAMHVDGDGDGDDGEDEKKRKKKKKHRGDAPTAKPGAFLSKFNRDVVKAGHPELKKDLDELYELEYEDIIGGKYA